MNKNWLKKERELFLKNDAMIRSNNIEMLHVALCICAISFFALWFMSFFMGEYQAFQTIYGLTSATFVCLYILHRYVCKGRYVNILIYISFILFFIYGCSSSFIFAPTYISVVVLLCQVVLPAIIVDRTSTITIFILIFYVLYVIGVVGFKTSDLVSDEIINMTAFTVVGITLGYYIRKMKMENYEHRRLALLHEHKDFLTDLYNRKKMFSDIETCIQTKQSYGAFLMMDVDHFKLYNDTFGHVSGDACLRKLGACMKAYAKAHEMNIYRFGGEEFAAILYSQDNATILASVEGLRNAIYQLQIPHTGTFEFVSISIGICLYHESIGFDEVIKRADQALYEAKRKGRNRIECYQEKTQEKHNA